MALSRANAGRRQRFRRLVQLLAPLADTKKPTAGTGRVLHILFSRHKEFAESPFAFNSGGASRFAIETAKNMASRKETRLILCTSDRNYKYTENGLDIRVLNSTELRCEDPWTWRLIPHVIWADVIHCHQYEQIGAALCITLARLLGKRVFASDLSAFQDRRFWWDHDLFRLVHGFLFVTPFSVDFTLPAYSKRKAVVVGGGHDPSIFFPPPTDNERDGVLFVGRLLPHKGVDVLIEAMPPCMPLRILGSKTEETAYTKLLQEKARGKNVTFLEYKQETDLAGEYRRAKICVLPSVNQDCFGQSHPRVVSFGLVLIEAQACGTPVICTDAGGVPEIVIEGETGIVVPQRSVEALRSAILRLSNDEGEWRRFSAAAKNFARQELTWSRMVDRCIAAYENPPN